MAGEWEAFRNVFSHLILPASLLGYFALAYISRMTRSFMLNELAQEYVIAARARVCRSRASSGATRCATPWCRW